MIEIIIAIENDGKTDILRLSPDFNVYVSFCILYFTDDHIKFSLDCSLQNEVECDCCCFTTCLK